MKYAFDRKRLYHAVIHHFVERLVEQTIFLGVALLRGQSAKTNLKGENHLALPFYNFFINMIKKGGGYMAYKKIKIGSLVVALMATSASAFAVSSTVSGIGVLGTPTEGSTISGIGVISGYHCTSEDIDIYIDGISLGKAGAGTTLLGTQSVCGRTNTGYSLLYNFNNLQPGQHVVEAYANGIFLESHYFNSVQSGGVPWLSGASKTTTVQDFPSPGQTATLEWVQSQQNFLVTIIHAPNTTPDTGNGGSVPTAPTGVNAAAGDQTVTISWNAVTGATSYNLYRASVSDITKSNYSSLTGGVRSTGVTSPTIQTSLTNGTAYYFVVTAVNANGESTESNLLMTRPQVASLPAGYVVQGGLTWMPETSSPTNWADADAYCANTAINGQTGWRLPTQQELVALSSAYPGYPSVLSDQGWNLGVAWSSTPSGTGRHYAIHVGTGGVFDILSLSYMTCVR